MQQAVLKHLPDVQATYKSTHRDKDVYFTRECYNPYLEALPRTSYSLDFSSSRCSMRFMQSDFSEFPSIPEEIDWLRKTFPFFGDSNILQILCSVCLFVSERQGRSRRRLHQYRKQRRSIDYWPWPNPTSLEKVLQIVCLNCPFVLERQGRTRRRLHQSRNQLFCTGNSLNSSQMHSV